ncbi:hypothetical protein LUZ60_003273 [Juncus effusus]|nr:hypothetical protein LUZ60_003273 [Juncus effusus]
MLSLNPIIIVLLTIIRTSILSCLAIDDQGQALLAWRQTLNTTNPQLDSWKPTDVNPCKWYGILCNPNSQVTTISLKSLDLQGCSVPSNLQPLKSLTTLVLTGTNLTGTIPKQIGDYSNLISLDLSKNQLSGEIPSELCKLSKLQTLSLNSNSLQGAIPSNLGDLSSLMYLTLYDNSLSGIIPSSIGNLKRLQTFRAGGNQNLKGPLPKEIGNCTDLTMIGLAETGISGSLPSSIGNLKKLETIAIYTAMLSGPIPDEIGNCTALTSLYLYQNYLTGSIPASLGQLKNLQNLLLWQNTLVGSIPPEIGGCTELILIDLSLNSLTGSIPKTIGQLTNLQQLQLSTNNLTGAVPVEISNCTELSDIEIDNNALSGEIQIDFSRLTNLTLFYAWQNRLTGAVPAKLAACQNLQSLDLSYNNLTGPIPKNLFSLQNLTKLLLISNELSGFIPPDIGNCTNLFRLRLNGNRLSGAIPSETGKLRNLNFLDMSGNLLVGPIPQSLSNCYSLEFLDLHSNGLTGPLPDLLPKSLQFIDFSDNGLTGPIGRVLGSLPELTKLNLGRNKLAGPIPYQIGSSIKLQLLDIGSNYFTGEIPPEIGLLPSLEISLNLSCNKLTGDIPSAFSNLNKLGLLDISYNSLSGGLSVLAGLQNLVTLNISYNSFSGELPNTEFFRKLPLTDLTGNRGLIISGNSNPGFQDSKSVSALKLSMSILIAFCAAVLVTGLYVLIRTRGGGNNSHVDDTWEVILYQKLDFSVDDVVRALTTSNVIGTGSSGVVYKVNVPCGDVLLAVKKMWSPTDESGAFRNEISTLGSIRHRNIVRLLGYGANRSTKLLFYNYLPNGSLSGFLHRGGKAATEWETRYEIALGIAHAIAYLHHDCVPAILHGDVKAMNVLLGPRFEPYLADFGLSRVLSPVCADQEFSSCQSNGGKNLDLSKGAPKIAGSYGYIAPEYASMQRITEKSDVYSYGVVLLEILTGRHPLDPALPGGTHLVQWVKDHLQIKRDPVELLDARLRGKLDSQIQEMHQAIAIAVLCVCFRADDRPTMKDVVALLKEIRRPVGDEQKESNSNIVTATTTISISPMRSMQSKESSSCSFANMSDYSC